MNTLPWDTDDSIESSYSLLLCCLGISIVLHLGFLNYFAIPEKKDSEALKKQFTTLTVNLKTTAKTVKKPERVKKTKKQIEKKAIDKKPKNNKNTLTTTSTAKPIQKHYSALEKVTPLPVKTPKKEKAVSTQEKNNSLLENIEKEEAKQIVEEEKNINEEKTIKYKALLESWLAQYKKYPIGAKKKRQQGTVVVSFTIDAEGKLLAHTITRASKYRLLNKAVIKMLKRASPMPAIPQEVRGGNTSFSYTIPIEFSLDRL